MTQHPKYLKGNCRLASDENFFFNCFLEYTFVSKIYPKLSGFFLASLSVNGLRSEIHGEIEDSFPYSCFSGKHPVLVIHTHDKVI